MYHVTCYLTTYLYIQVEMLQFYGGMATFVYVFSEWWCLYINSSSSYWRSTKWRTSLRKMESYTKCQVYI